MSLANPLAHPDLGPVRLLGTGRGRTLAGAVLALAILAAIALGAWAMGEDGLRSSAALRSLPPGPAHPFGTDPLGRDMLVRTVKGLAVSLRIGLMSAGFAAVLATVLGILAALDRRLDVAVGGLIDLVLALPHLVLLILISFAAGGGTRGVIIAVVLTHWPTLARIVRAEMKSVLAADFVAVSRRMGTGPLRVALAHVAPHMLPQLLVGTVLLFPHAILHEAAMTFLGFGLEPHRPAIGILLSESMRYVTSGQWWLGVLPGLALLGMVLTFERVAAGMRLILDPRRAQE